jgi:arylsulfatase A-like enzyme
LLVVLGSLLGAAAAPARENFLLLVGDDLGVDQVGVYSDDTAYGHPGEGASPAPTPHLDALAAEGVLFRNAWASPVCSPTRALTLTGRHAFRTGIGEVGGTLDVSERILPELLAATHQSAALGKWHLGGNDAEHPIDSGFGYYAGALLGSVADYFSWRKTTAAVSGPSATQARYTVYATTDTAQEAIARIAAFGDAPWILWVAFNAPHAPFHVPDFDTGVAMSDASDDATKYRAAVAAMDIRIGDILESIPAEVLADTTIVFFGDNGTPSQAVSAPFVPSRAKGSVYEGGINVPLIVKSPWIDPADEGSESLALVHTVDLFATVAEMAGMPDSTEDSVSLVPYLQDPSLPTQSLRPTVYSETFSPNGSGPYASEERAIRNETYKLIWRDEVYEEMYRLESDPFETDNLLLDALGAEQQEAFDTLSAAMEALHAPQARCADGLDNDGDTRIDYPDDPQCSGPDSDTEGPGPACGLGAELTLLLPLIRRIWNHRSRRGERRADFDPSRSMQ